MTPAEAWQGIAEGLWRSRQLTPSTVKTARDQRRFELYECRGACSELALSKWSTLSWTARGTVRGVADVGRDLDAKSRVGAGSRLILNEHDPDGYRYVLVVAAHPAYQLVGWIWGHRAKVQGRWLPDKWRGRVCYVDQRALFPMETLLEGYGVWTCLGCGRLVPQAQRQVHGCADTEAVAAPGPTAPTERREILLHKRSQGEDALCGGCGEAVEPGGWWRHRCPRLV